MSKFLSRAEACTLLGCADRELVDIFDSEHGPIFEMSDGNSLIDVHPDTPDFDGKTGLMFFHAPNVGGRGYTGDFPVFVNQPADMLPTYGGELEDLSKLTNARLIAHGAALDPPVVLDKKLNKTQLLTALAEAAVAAQAADEADDDGEGGDE